MQTLVERDSDFALAGIVQMDDGYWGGERHRGSTGRGSPGKAPFVAVVRCTAEGYPIAIRMDVVAAFRKNVLTAWAQRHLVLGTAVVFHGLNCFPGIADADCTHTVIATGGGVSDLGHPIFLWINTVLGNVKNAFQGIYHALRPVYLQRYLSGFCYRINRRFDLAALVPRRYRPATLDVRRGESEPLLKLHLVHLHSGDLVHFDDDTIRPSQRTFCNVAETRCESCCISRIVYVVSELPSRRTR